MPHSRAIGGRHIEFGIASSSAYCKTRLTISSSSSGALASFEQFSYMFSCVRTGCDSSRGRESWKLSQLSQLGQLSCSLLFDQPHCRHHRLTPDLHSHINYIQLKWPHLSPWDCPTRYKFWNVFAKLGTSGTSPGKSTGQTRGSISDHLDRHRPRFTMFHRPTIHSLGLCLAKNNLLFAL